MDKELDSYIRNAFFGFIGMRLCLDELASNIKDTATSLPEGACNVFYLPGGVEGVNVAFILTPTRPGAPGGGVVLLEDS